MRRVHIIWLCNTGMAALFTMPQWAIDAYNFVADNIVWSM